MENVNEININPEVVKLDDNYLNSSKSKLLKVKIEPYSREIRNSYYF